MWRNIAIALLALSGVGLIYLLSKTVRIEPGNVGVVINYNAEPKDQIELLKPGYHVLLSPFRQLMTKEMPSENKSVLSKEKVTITTTEGLEIQFTVDFQYKVTDPKAVITNVMGDNGGNYEVAIKQAIETGIVQTLADDPLSYQKLINNEAHTLDSAITNTKSLVSIKQFCTDAIVKINAICETWGIKISLLQLIDPQPIDLVLKKHMQENSRSLLQARNTLVSATQQAQTMKILADGNANAAIAKADGDAGSIIIEARARAEARNIEAQGYADAAKTISKSPEAMAILQLQTNVDIADKLRQAKQPLMLGSGLNPALLFQSAPIVRTDQKQVFEPGQTSIFNAVNQ